jgi:hypothetical protein
VSHGIRALEKFNLSRNTHFSTKVEEHKQKLCEVGAT